MAFSEKVKNEVKKKAFFRCAVCQQAFVEVHHIIPQEEGGEDTLDNAAPLCASCHDLYGGNPGKRKQIRQMRDDWYERVAAMQKVSMEEFRPIVVDKNGVNALKDKKIAIYHVFLAEETFASAARMLVRLVAQAQENMPNQPRVLYLEIDGHRNEKGGFDKDMAELLIEFMCENLMPYLSEAHTPLGDLKNTKMQKNDVPQDLMIFGFEDFEQ